MRTLQNLIDRVRLITGDTTSAQFQDTDIARWATDAQLDHIRETETSWLNVSIGPSVASQVAYPVAGGFLKVRDVYYDGVRIVPSTLNDINTGDPYRNQAASVGQPSKYWLTKDTINLYPAPDSSGKTVRAELVPRPTDLVNTTDVFVVPDDMFETIVRHCLQKAAEWGEDWQAASYFKKDVDDRTARDMHHEATANSNSYPVIRDAVGEW